MNNKSLFLYNLNNFIKMLYNCRPKISPWWFLAIFLVLVLSLVIFLLLKKKNLLKNYSPLGMGLFLTYGFWALVATVLGRGKYPSFQYELIPFWSYKTWITGEANMLPEIVSNILFFIPFGFFAMQTKALSKKQILIIGFAFPCVVEFLQLVTKTGLCEFDDVFNNFIGTALGMLLAIAFNKIVKKSSKDY